VEKECRVVGVEVLIQEDAAREARAVVKVGDRVKVVGEKGKAKCKIKER